MNKPARQLARSAFHRQQILHFRSSATPRSVAFFANTSVHLAATNSPNSSSIATKSKIVYLHVGPSGDFWTGDSIFAAKHLQPDYVRSIPLTDNETLLPLTIVEENDATTDILLGLLDENEEWAREIYDTENFPQDFMERLKEKVENQKRR